MKSSNLRWPLSQGSFVKPAPGLESQSYVHDSTTDNYAILPPVRCIVLSVSLPIHVIQCFSGGGPVHARCSAR